MISAIVLAAGESRRMGETKQLLPWHGKTVLGHLLDTLLSSSVDEVILVLGHEAERILEKVATRKIKVVFNPDYQKGMSTSLRRGLMAMDQAAEAFLVVLADQPAITPAIINQLIHSFRRFQPGKSIVAPTFRGRRGHPVLFGRKYREEFWGLTGEVGGREILARHQEDTLVLEMDTDAVLIDLDTPEDYQSHSGRTAK
jgi:molybdenum cofactor cytidylyltransferase